MHKPRPQRCCAIGALAWSCQCLLVEALVRDRLREGGRARDLDPAGESWRWLSLPHRLGSGRGWEPGAVRRVSPTTTPPQAPRQESSSEPDWRIWTVGGGSRRARRRARNIFSTCSSRCDPISGESLGGRLTVPGNSAPVAGFDLTFSPSKSVSVAWALADENTKAVIADCHRQAIDYVISYAESHVLHSRSGAGGIVEEDVTGVVAASFTHFTSRADDPQLHDHVVVWNRARRSLTGSGGPLTPRPSSRRRRRSQSSTKESSPTF